jgi:hypothetical protein
LTGPSNENNAKTIPTEEKPDQTTQKLMYGRLFA